MGSNNVGFRTEVDFQLPKGYVDESGTLHRQGVMRLATAADEILPLRDPRVQQNEAYLTVIVLSRVITRLGSVSDIHPGVIERLYASDVAYLQRLYDELNFSDGESASSDITARPGAGSLRRMSTMGEA
jgi:hypothetical protein